MLLLAFPVVVGLVMWLVARETSLEADSVEHTLRVELSLERLLSALENAEANHRDSTRTGEKRYLEAGRSDAREALREIAALRRSITDSPRQQAALARLQPLIESRLAVLAQNQPLEPETAAAGERSFLGQVQSVATELRAEEERVLSLREADRAMATRRLYWSLALGYGSIILVVGSLYRAVTRYSRESREASGRLSELNAELDERVRARTASLASREELLRLFVKHVPVAVAMLDRNLRHVLVSDRWAAAGGCDTQQILGREMYEIFPDIPEHWKEIHRRGLAGETLRAEEDRWDRSHGETWWLFWEVIPWGDRDGLPEGILIFAEDVTARRRIEGLLRESEATLRALLETAAQAILAIDPNGSIVIANRMAGTMFGYEPGGLLGQPIEILLPERLRRRHAVQRRAFSADPKPRHMGAGLDLTGLRRDGSEFPVEISLSSLGTAKGPLAVAFVSDITARKEAEAVIRGSEEELRALAGSLFTAQEDERRRVARELHDDITQRMAFLSIELGKLAGQAPDSFEEVHGKIRALQQQTMAASREVRRLSHGLHPSVIEDFGLSIALEEFCLEFGQARGVRVFFESSEDEVRPDSLAATCLYRIAQESLRNAVIHGCASEIHVTLSGAPGSVQLVVSDNGVGFSPDQTREAAGLGLVSMRERIRLVKGTLTLVSSPGQGTEVTALVPLSQFKHEEKAHTAG